MMQSSPRTEPNNLPIMHIKFTPKILQMRYKLQSHPFHFSGEDINLVIFLKYHETKQKQKQQKNVCGNINQAISPF